MHFITSGKQQEPPHQTHINISTTQSKSPEEVNEIEGNKSKWGFDVTDLLRNFVAEELNDLQPMLHNDSFSLLESMSAIEARICICTKSIDILSC